MNTRYEITFVPYATQPPSMANTKTELFLQPYSFVPNWATPPTNANFFFTTARLDINGVDLIAFSNWHTANSQLLFTTNIGNSYLYRYDGTVNSINDGGNDMYDGGNFISFSTTRGTTNLTAATNINYGTLSNFTPLNYGFFISQPNIWPQISFAYTKSGTTQWRINGDVGTDGGGLNNNVSGTYTTPTEGRYGSFWTNQNYGTVDPTIATTWFTILQSNLGSVITSCNDNRNLANPPPNAMNQNFTVTGTNYFFGCILLSSRNTSRSTGELIPINEIQNFISNYVTNANIIIS